VKYRAKFLRPADLELVAESMTAAAVSAQRIAMTNGWKLMSIYVEGYVEPPEPEKPVPRGGPKPGGTPGAGTARREILVDQIAKAA